MKKFALLLPVLAGILFGSVGVFVRSLYSAGLDNTTVIFLRALFAAIMLFIYILIRDRSLFVVGKAGIKWIFCSALLGMMATNLLFNVSSTHLSLAFAAVLVCIAPVYTMIISRFVFGHEITRKKVICSAMTILGCIFVSGVIGSKVELSALGLLAGIISGVSYSLYCIFSKKGTDSGLKSLTITFYCMVIIAVATCSFADFSAAGAYMMESPVSHIAFLLLHSLCVGMLPYMLLTISMQYINPSTASILATIEPVAAMVFGIIFFGEIPGVLSVCGLVITLAALAFLCKE